jgi:protein kinase C substrate 80K-H
MKSYLQMAKAWAVASALLILACAEKDEIWKIVEEEKCVYRMEVGTPAVCGVEVQKAVPEHSEL